MQVPRWAPAARVAPSNAAIIPRPDPWLASWGWRVFLCASMAPRRAASPYREVVRVVTTISKEPSMKTLVAFYTAGVRGDRRFVPAQWLNTVVIRPGRSFLEATKYRIVVDEQGVCLGATELDARHVGPTLSLGSLRAHIVMPNG